MTDLSVDEQAEQRTWLIMCTRYSEGYINSLDSHELRKLYHEKRELMMG